MTRSRFHIIRPKSADVDGVRCPLAAPAHLDTEFNARVGTHPDDDVARYRDPQTLARFGEALTPSLHVCEFVVREVSTPAGASSITHLLHISDPLYGGHRTWLARLEGLPADGGDAELAGWEFDVAEVYADLPGASGTVQ